MNFWFEGRVDAFAVKVDHMKPKDLKKAPRCLFLCRVGLSRLSGMAGGGAAARAGREEIYRALFRAALDDDPIGELRMVLNQNQPIAHPFSRGLKSDSRICSDI